MIRKGLVSLIVFLLVGTSIVSAFNAYISDDKKIQYEGDKNSNWLQIDKLQTTNNQFLDLVGWSVSINGDIAVLGAPSTLSGKGAVYIFKRNGSSWEQEIKLTATNATTWEYLGWFVSASSDYVIAGAPQGKNSNINTGSAFIFNRHQWSDVTKLNASDGEIGDSFGVSVSIYGKTAIVGADYDENGSAYIYRRNESGWFEETKLTAFDGATNDDFGFSVSIYRDYIAVGSVGDNTWTGAVYIFRFNGSAWVLDTKLTASDGQSGDTFGYSVSLSGEYLLVGSRHDNSGTGSAYIFKREEATWMEKAKLTASDGEPNDEFGFSVSLDGDTAIAGAYGHDNFVGSAYIFKRYDETWVQESELYASNGVPDDQFAFSVSIDDDYAIAGSALGNNGFGCAYVFQEFSSPETPTIDGPTSGEVEELLSYSAVSTDPYGNNISYFFDWGDGTNSSWTEFVPSGNPIDITNSWAERGVYEVKVKAKNIYESISDWSEPLIITIGNNSKPKPDIYGPNEGIIKKEYFYNVVTVDPDGDDVYYYVDWDDGMNTGWVGPYHSGENLTISHIWSKIGVYNVKIKAKDTWGAASDWSTLVVNIKNNTPPAIPDIQGPTSGKIATIYNYTMVTTDYDYDFVYYLIDWGDGSISGWLGPYLSGLQQTSPHSWSKKGMYVIKVKAKDTWGAESDWGTLEVKMPRVISFNSLFMKILERFPHAFPILRSLLYLKGIVV